MGCGSSAPSVPVMGINAATTAGPAWSRKNALSRCFMRRPIATSMPRAPECFAQLLPSNATCIGQSRGYACEHGSRRVGKECASRETLQETGRGANQGGNMAYASPEVLVTTDWVNQNLGNPRIKLVEVNVDTQAYNAGHIPGAIGWNWQTQTQDQIRRDILSREGFERLLMESGLGSADT